MKRQIIKIDEELCNGCGVCVPNCKEGALQVIDGKARLISDLFCDGLGACIGECPEGAITIEEREAEPYDEIKVMEKISGQGENTLHAHLQHLKEHGETGYLSQALHFLKLNNITTQFMDDSNKNAAHSQQEHSGCPGSRVMDFRDSPASQSANDLSTTVINSELRQWPVQMHLINPLASYFQHSDLLLAADCVAFAMGDFHSKFLKSKSLAIACPKLDSNKEIYVEKLVRLIDEAKINTITVIIMEVPCCGGLLQLVKLAQNQAQRKVPVKQVLIGLKGDVLNEEWN